MSVKISAAEAATVYAEVPGVLRGLAADRDRWMSKCASMQAELNEFRTTDRIEKIARQMEDKNVDVGTSFDDKCDKIKTAAASGRSLDVIEEAVGMTAPTQSMGNLGNELEYGNSANSFEAMLLGDA